MTPDGPYHDLSSLDPHVDLSRTGTKSLSSKVGGPIPSVSPYFRDSDLLYSSDESTPCLSVVTVTTPTRLSGSCNPTTVPPLTPLP